MVDEVLLHLIEHEVDLASDLCTPLREDVGELECRLGHGRTRSRRDCRARVVAPLIDHHRQSAISYDVAAARGNKGSKPANDSGPQQRALADAARPVEHGQPRRDEIRCYELGLAIATEEEPLVEL